MKVLKEATAEAGLKPSDRPKITLKHHELGEARKGYAAPKLYKAKVEPAPTPVAAIDDFDRAGASSFEGTRTYL